MNVKLIAVSAVVCLASLGVGVGGMWMIGPHLFPALAPKPEVASAGAAVSKEHATEATPASEAVHVADTAPAPAEDHLEAAAQDTASATTPPVTSPEATASAPAEAPEAASHAVTTVVVPAPGSTARVRVSLPAMAAQLGPFSSRLGTIGCLNNHIDTGARPTWACTVTLKDVSEPIKVTAFGPRNALGSLTLPLAKSGYLFDFTAAQGGKPAQLMTVIDPAAAPYATTVQWTTATINAALADAIKVQAQHDAAKPKVKAVPTVADANAESWAAAGLKENSGGNDAK